MKFFGEQVAELPDELQVIAAWCFRHAHERKMCGIAYLRWNVAGRGDGNVDGFPRRSMDGNCRGKFLPELLAVRLRGVSTGAQSIGDLLQFLRQPLEQEGEAGARIGPKAVLRDSFAQECNLRPYGIEPVDEADPA